MDVWLAKKEKRVSTLSPPAHLSPLFLDRPHDVDAPPLLSFSSTSPAPSSAALIAPFVAASTMFDMLTTLRARGLFPRPRRKPGAAP